MSRRSSTHSRRLTPTRYPPNGSVHGPVGTPVPRFTTTRPSGSRHRLPQSDTACGPAWVRAVAAALSYIYAVLGPAGPCVRLRLRRLARSTQKKAGSRRTRPPSREEI
ncbi:hypothetical protein Val02_77010 [Virgisporangium aliadipatigenens]|uniref:Uncharacterized protein n=1 Tax=Virgisporangium aliadipatigenens TaxID=741659 RepID=A0A8J4DU11_9ACTN|nr:hypothetical protein Val02_77010 [Virgisporangium aliadipatigenens]